MTLSLQDNPITKDGLQCADSGSERKEGPIKRKKSYP